MAGYSSRSDQLWCIALQLAEEELKSIPFAQREEHGQRIHKKYNQLVGNLSCLGDIVAAMYEKEKLTSKEFEQIQQLRSTPIRANEELLGIITRKPKDVFECFLSVIKDTNQLHLYQMLVSGDNVYDEAQREDAPRHKDLIRRNFMWLSENMDAESGLISLLYQQNVLTVRERESIFSIIDTFQKKEFLLGMLSKKSPEEFEKFLNALEDTGQGHLAKKLRKPAGLPVNSAKIPSGDSTPKDVSHSLLPPRIRKSSQNTFPAGSISRPVVPPKSQSKPGQILVESRSLSMRIPPPKPETQSTSAQHRATSIYSMARTTGKSINVRRTNGEKYQAMLKGLQSRLHSDIAVKASSISLSGLKNPEDSLQMCFHILLQECSQMRKEIVSRNTENNTVLEQLMESASQSSDGTTLNEADRSQLQSVQQKMQSKKELMQLKEKINKLENDIHNEKVKCKQLEDDKLKLKDRLNKLEYELQKTKENLEERNVEVISLRGEGEKLKEACEPLRKENKSTTDDLLKKCQYNPVSHVHVVDMIRPQVVQEGKKMIEGLTILGKELFVTSEESSEIEVYDLIKLSFSRLLTLRKLFHPWDIASCDINKCLYIFNYKGFGQSNEILRVNLDGNLMKNWSTGDDFGLLSVTDESNIILTVYNKPKLNEYSQDGQLIGEINLSSYAGIRSPLHAIKLTNGQFVVSHGYSDNDPHKICIVDAGGKLIKSFGGKSGSDLGRTTHPVYLSVDRHGFVLVVDQSNSRILLLDSNLEFTGEILPTEKWVLRRPRRIVLDESRSRMLIADSEYDGRLLIFRF